ncbi:hypothetical protein [Bacillus thuringiensis]|uniref:hypothetical protein n=1 Tax=Bacillus thuringiensis TaxID=1428 RepID=UPI0011AB03AE|nr:hypothetical protein [Bacillus thuringiensis]
MIFQGKASSLTGFEKKEKEKLLPEGEVIRGPEIERYGKKERERIETSGEWTEKLLDFGHAKVKYNEGHLTVTYKWNEGYEHYKYKTKLSKVDMNHAHRFTTDFKYEIEGTGEDFQLTSPVQRIFLTCDHEKGGYIHFMYIREGSGLGGTLLGVPQPYTKKLSYKPVKTDLSKISIYDQGGKIYLHNKTNDSIQYNILNSNQDSVAKGSIKPKGRVEYDISELTTEWMSMYKNPDYCTLIFTVNDIPVYKTNSVLLMHSKYGDRYNMGEGDIISDQKSSFSTQLKNGHRLEYWHMNTNALSPSYDSIYFQPIDSKLLGLLTKYEVKVKGMTISENTVLVHNLELDGKIRINFFDYTQDESKHPKKGNDFDALYLLPIPAGLTESVTSYDIQIGNERHNTVSFERQENGSYIRDQRLKLDFFKNKFPQEKLPKLHDHIELIIHTLEKQTVTIDLGKVEESTNPASINALEKAHEIKKWEKVGDHYTHVEFNTGSEHITSYVVKVNNSYYGEIPINQVTKNLDLSKLNNDKKIQKGDYVEMYAYKKDGEEVLIQSRYAGTTGLLGEYPIEKTTDIRDECTITAWSKTSDSYTSFTLGNLSDLVDSHIKKYEGYVNNKIVTLTQKGTTFGFGPKQAPHHGDIVQITVYTYTGKVIKLAEQPAGAIGKVTDEEIQSIHQPKEWTDTNQTIVFDTSKLRDPIQAHVKSYTIEVWKRQNKNWETFGSPIQMNAQGQLRLQDCKASQSLPQIPNVVRVIANLVDSGRKPVVAMIRKVGSLKLPPTEQEMKAKHTTYTGTFTDNNKKIESLTFLNIDNELASYISGYDVQDASGTVNGLIAHKLTLPKATTPGLTVTFKTPIPIKHQQEIGVSSGRTKPIDVDLCLYAVANCMIMEEEGKQPEPQQKLTPLLVMGIRQGDKSIKGVTLHPPISTEDIKQAHIIDEWDYTGPDENVRQFYFNKKIEPYVKDIKYYSVKINGVTPPQNPKTAPFAETEEKHTITQGFPIRFGDYGLTGSRENPLPKSGDTLEVIAHLQNSATPELSVIQCTIPPKFPPLSKVQTRKLKEAHQIDGRWVKSGNVYTTLFFNKAVKPYLEQIDHYSITINKVPHEPKDHISLELEEEREIGLPKQKGLPIRIQNLGVKWADLPTDESSIEIFAHLKGSGGTDESNQPTKKISVYGYRL